MAEDVKEESVASNDESDRAASDGSLSNTMLTEGSCLLRRMEICVAEAEKRSGKNAVSMQETYTVYLVETRPMDAIAEGRNPPPDSLWRRYSEFELLRNYLIVTYPYIVVPPLPEKRSSLPKVQRRFSDFMWQEHGWKEMVYETGFQTKADSRLRALSATFRVRSPHKRLVEMKHYSDGLQSHTSQLLRARTRVADRLYAVYKVHGNYGRVFSEWSAIEKEMGDGLQSAGHHMDAYAASVDDILEEEEHYADQLKEYLSYAEALRAVCRKHELSQFELEMASQDVISKKQQREELATGIVRTFSLKGMTNKLFGQEAPEQREAKLNLLEELIAEGEETVKEKTAECDQHAEKAWADIVRFKDQKDKDLKEAFINYALMQISMCKKGIQVWSNAKECFLKM
ncbi:sorting nexin-4-like isoform X4 [Xiphophorus hellerii]|uniref:sorting nexin-4-like isoform X4 n=1 Tax=Xiphophorus hellerii TaxID=8084 RepID=UPI0013B41DAA|nr:sorting nexin-4-like isoform X4 [Xiphophorus hellerii]